MSQVMFWMLGVAFAAAAMVMTSAMDAHIAQFALAMVISAFIAISGLRDHHALWSEGANAPRLAAALARHMGLLWAWAAVSVVLIYSLIITSWSGWFACFLILVMGAALCLFLANILVRDADQADPDPRIINLVNWIARVQFAATCLAVGGLLAFGKFSANAFGGEAKWAAVNIMLCAAMALAGLSGYAVAQQGAEIAADTHVEPLRVATKRPRRIAV
jgi:hypothetical protein